MITTIKCLPQCDGSASHTWQVTFAAPGRLIVEEITATSGRAALNVAQARIRAQLGGITRVAELRA